MTVTHTYTMTHLCGSGIVNAAPDVSRGLCDLNKALSFSILHSPSVFKKMILQQLQTLTTGIFLTSISATSLDNLNSIYNYK